MSLPQPEVISALAAFASAWAALASYFTARQVADSSVRPVLTGIYIFDDDCIRVTNSGSGPALNLRLQSMNQHYTDSGTIESYSMEKGSPRLILPGESKKISFVIDGKDSSDSVLRKLATFSVYYVAKKKSLGVIYDDLNGKAWISKLQLRSDNNSFELTGYKRYRAYYILWDFLHTKLFYLTKRFRDQKI
jgi:hypothetical protein